MATFNEICNRVADALPEGWGINIALTHTTFHVELIDPEFESTNCSGEESDEEQVVNAINYAVKAAKMWYSDGWARLARVEIAARTFWESFHADGCDGEWKDADDSVRRNIIVAMDEALYEVDKAICFANAAIARGES